MTHDSYYYSFEDSGVTREEAKARGWEITTTSEEYSEEELWAAEEAMDPEMIKDANHRRALIHTLMDLWENSAENWRTLRYKYLFYRDLKKALKLKRPDLRSNLVTTGWRHAELFEIVNRIDARNYLEGLSTGELSYTASFLQNWLKYDYTYTTLSSYVYDIRQLLRIMGVGNDFQGDILNNPEFLKRPDGHSYHRVVSNINFRYRTHSEYSRAAAIY